MVDERIVGGELGCKPSNHQHSEKQADCDELFANFYVLRDLSQRLTTIHTDHLALTRA